MTPFEFLNGIAPKVMNRIRFKNEPLVASGIPKDDGFTVVELLVVLGVIAMLGSFFLPVMARARDRSASFSNLCLNNERQLIIAALMYADDNLDSWVPNQPVNAAAWCALTMDFNGTHTSNTNILALTNPAVCVIGPFIQNPRIFHCPADNSTVAGEGARVRSVSMSQSVGTTPVNLGCTPAGGPVNGQWLTGVNIGTGCQTVYRTYGKTSQMIAPTPANLWIFCDEHPDSINDAMFAVQMANTGPFSTIIDYPASYHDGAGSFSFADGHVETHKWVGQSIQLPMTETAFAGITAHSAGDSSADVLWLQQHTSAHR